MNKSHIDIRMEIIFILPSHKTGMACASEKRIGTKEITV